MHLPVPMDRSVSHDQSTRSVIGFWKFCSHSHKSERRPSAPFYFYYFFAPLPFLPRPLPHIRHCHSKLSSLCSHFHLPDTITYAMPPKNSTKTKDVKPEPTTPKPKVKPDPEVAETPKKTPSTSARKPKLTAPPRNYKKLVVEEGVTASIDIKYEGTQQAVAQTGGFSMMLRLEAQNAFTLVKTVRSLSANLGLATPLICPPDRSHRGSLRGTPSHPPSAGQALQVHGPASRSQKCRLSHVLQPQRLD